MNTFIEAIQNDFDIVKENFTEFILNYSNLRYSPCPPGFIGFSDYSWSELTPAGVKFQSDLYLKYNHLMEIVEVLLSDVPSEYIAKFKECKRIVLSFIEQDTQIWNESLQEITQSGINELDIQLKLVNDLFRQNMNSYIYVPDTNALLINPELEKWDFECSKFEILLMPTVLSELDHLKLFGRNEIVRTNANKLIRQLKEYRRRGRLIDGVTLKKEKSTIKTFAIEPDFSKTLSWLKADNGDDRLLASFIEVLRKNPNDYVNLVTADINLQNKAEYANLPFVEVPGN